MFNSCISPVGISIQQNLNAVLPASTAWPATNMCAADPLFVALATALYERILQLRYDGVEDRSLLLLSSTISIEDVETYDNLVSRLIDLDQALLHKPKLMTACVQRLDACNDYKISGEELAKGRVSWARYEADKVRLLYSYFRSLCRRSKVSKSVVTTMLKMKYFDKHGHLEEDGDDGDGGNGDGEGDGEQLMSYGPNNSHLESKPIDDLFSDCGSGDSDGEQTKLLKNNMLLGPSGTQIDPLGPLGFQSLDDATDAQLRDLESVDSVEQDAKNLETAEQHAFRCEVVRGSDDQVPLWQGGPTNIPKSWLEPLGPDTPEFGGAVQAGHTADRLPIISMKPPDVVLDFGGERLPNYNDITPFALPFAQVSPFDPPFPSKQSSFALDVPASLADAPENAPENAPKDVLLAAASPDIQLISDDDAEHGAGVADADHDSGDDDAEHGDHDAGDDDAKHDAGDDDAGNDGHDDDDALENGVGHLNLAPKPLDLQAQILNAKESCHERTADVIGHRKHRIAAALDEPPAKRLKGKQCVQQTEPTPDDSAAHVEPTPTKRRRGQPCNVTPQKIAPPAPSPSSGPSSSDTSLPAVVKEFNVVIAHRVANIGLVGKIAGIVALSKLEFPDAEEVSMQLEANVLSVLRGLQGISSTSS